MPTQPYKIELIDGIEDESVGLYQQGDFVDLCQGPHVERTGEVPAFKLMSVAGAYWRGDEKNPMLQRIYGALFDSKEELDAYLEQIEEALRRDHRKLGRELDLFSFHEEFGPGLVYWHPKGGRVRTEIEDFWRAEHFRHGYELVYTPHMGKSTLWETSGHLDFYNENMYSPMDVDGQDYYVKPMNCPFHIQIYKNGLQSYRDLPIRLGELGTVYRYERSGVLHGLLRVRGFTQDDAHIFCRPDQVRAEIEGCVDFMMVFLNAFGFEKFHVYLATRDESGKYAGSLEDWGMATNVAARRHPGARLAVRHGRGRRRILRPEDRRQDDRRARPRVAVHNDPVRLQSAGAVRRLLHRRGRPRAPAIHGAPGAARLDGALLRRARRALRRRVPALAGAGAGHGHPDRGPSRGVRQQGG